MVNKKVVIICSIIAIIIVGGIVAKEVIELKKVNYTEEEIQVSNQKVVENQIEENEVEEQNTAKEDENITQNETEKNNVTPQIQGEEETTTDKDAEKEKTGKEKAIKLAEEEWGEDDTVYFTIDNQEGSTYFISVRSKNTTETLAEFEVNITGETVIAI